jgi:hypothetical protein
VLVRTDREETKQIGLGANERTGMAHKRARCFGIIPRDVDPLKSCSEPETPVLPASAFDTIKV